MHFSTSALQLITSYLIGRKQYVKIDHLASNYENVVFGVPQGSILGPVLFNIYVSDLSTKPSDGTHVIQYADDTTFYRHCKLKYLRNTEKLLQDDIDAIMTWSKNKNLLFNHKKTVVILFSTSQLNRVHTLDDKTTFTINANGAPLERVSSWKILGLTFDENLSWRKHVDETISAAYGTLQALRRIRRITPYHVRKCLAESLVLSKLDFGKVAYNNSPTT